MSSMDEDVSEINLGRWREPFTPSGVRLGGEGASAFFQVHEVGSKLVGGEWDHRGVCSPFWRAYFNAKAGAAVRHAGRRTELRPDRVVLVPAELIFDCVPGGDVGHTWVHFSVPVAAPKLRAPLAVVLPPYARALAREVQARARLKRGDATLNHTVLAWLHAVWSCAELGAQPVGSPRLVRAWAMIGGSLAAPPTVGQLAGACGMSAGAFIRWFKAETGTTPSEAITQRRVTEASRLLRYTELSVEQVAAKLGYANRYHFSRVFARVAGCGPATYRRGAGA
jgi:AraC-like DNA-binding protein